MADKMPASLDSLSLAATEPQVADLEREGKLNQATFFHCVDEQNAKTLQVLLRSRKVDVNAYNKEGLTALHIAVSHYDKSRSTDIVKTLLEAGADVNKKAADHAGVAFVSILGGDSKHGKGETSRIKYDHLTPLLLALELKSALYVKGWEYRHWDALLGILAAATIKQASDADVHAVSQEHGHVHTASLAAVQTAWGAVFDSGAHNLVDVRAEGKEFSVLKEILTHSSKQWKREIESQEHSARSTSLTPRGLLIEVKDASYAVIKHVLRYLYSGLLDDEFLKTRGGDVFLAAHKYEIPALCHLLERKLHITPENWIKVLSAATTAGSSLLTLRVAESVKQLLDHRLSTSYFRRPSFSYMDLPPNQLFRKSEDGSAEAEVLREGDETERP